MDQSQRKKQVKAEIFARALELEILERGGQSGWDLPEEVLFGILLKTVREFRGMSQRQLAKASKVERVTILALEAGRQHPQKSTVTKLAKGLRVPESQLEPRNVFRYIPDQPEKVAEQMRDPERALDRLEEAEKRFERDRERA